MAETVGSSFCREVGVCQHSSMQIILILQVSHFVEKNGGTLVCFRLACSAPAPAGNVEQEFPSTKWILYISGFQG